MVGGVGGTTEAVGVVGVVGVVGDEGEFGCPDELVFTGRTWSIAGISFTFR